MRQHEADASSACDGRPSGRLVYDDTKRGVAVWEVDGGGSDADVLYCQCLCLLSKLFIQHKTVYYDVNPFLFYILTLAAAPSADDDDEGDSAGSGGERLAAYFSKEKTTTEQNNLACIVTLPHMQQKGYGRFLIQLSYQLTLHAARTYGRRPTGGPERPLSELAVISYTSYWCDEVSRMLAGGRVGSFVLLRDMAHSTAIERSDLMSALQALQVECSEREGEMGVRVSRDVRQRMVRRVEEEEAKRVERGDIEFNADCLRLDEQQQQQAEEMLEMAEETEETEGVEGASEAGQRVDDEEEEAVVAVRKVRRKGGKRRSLVVSARKNKKPKSAVKREAKSDDDEDWEADSNEEEDGADG